MTTQLQRYGVKSPKRGGKRVGAGRPPLLAKQLVEGEKLAASIYYFRQLGLRELAEKTPDLMHLAIRTAEGEFNPDHKPNVLMLKTLLELVMRVGAPPVDEEESPIASILRNIRAGVANIQINVGGAVEANSGQRPVAVEGQAREATEVNA